MPTAGPQKDFFYIYVLYTINRQRSNKLYEENRKYFVDIQNEIGDSLGVNSFLTEPVQRLPKYKLLLGQLFKELRKMFGVDKMKSELAACCLAEKRLQRLLDTVNEAMRINDISECNDVSINIVCLIRSKAKFMKYTLSHGAKFFFHFTLHGAQLVSRAKCAFIEVNLVSIENSFDYFGFFVVVACSTHMNFFYSSLLVALTRYHLSGSELLY